MLQLHFAGILLLVNHVPELQAGIWISVDVSLP